ncbi:MAG TPA: hypothetical protein VEX11_09860, partial [Acetobacteraceae bacterium]|nr:hypothetical protein [Acetobacteraceae bacterium]
MTVVQRRSRRILAAAFAGALVPAAVATGASAEESDTEIQTLIEQKVAPELIEEIDGQGDAELWLLFAGSPDYSAALAADTKEEKGVAAVAAAKSFADTSQAEVAAALDESGVDYQSFW